MRENVVGLDWDNISKKTALQRQKKVEQQENAQTLLYQTRHGFHLEIIYPQDKTVKENLRLREKYQDCTQRLLYSKKRYQATGKGYDILFNTKKGFQRKLIK